MKNILMMVGMCLTILFGYNMTNPVTEANTHAIREVKVQAGDTMWDIAARTAHKDMDVREMVYACLLYTSPSPRDYAASRMPSSA